MELFAERGVSLTVREVAAAAGVSPGLVMHHFGSKDGLRDAVDRKVAEFVDAMLADLVGGVSASLGELFADRLETEPAVAAYLSRMFRDGGPSSDALFRRLFEVTRAGMRMLVDAGEARPAPDEDARSAFLVANDVAMILFRRQILTATGIDPLERAGLVRWTAAVVDVYTNGIFESAVPPT